MWNRRSLRLIATVLVTVPLAGCHSWHTATTSPAEVIAQKQPFRVRVTLTDEKRLTLVQLTMRNDSIAARSHVVALSDVSTIEIQRFDTEKTLWLVIAPPLFVAVAIAALLGGP